MPITAECRRVREPTTFQYIADDGWMFQTPKGEVNLTDKVWGGHIKVRHPNVTIDDIARALYQPDRCKRINHGYLFEKRICDRILWVIVRQHEVVTAYYR